ncbi:MAG: DUF2157 domain-containing protein [Blastomonas sp.]
MKLWLEAGLIDEATLRRIADFEAERSRPLGLWAIIGIGALAIGLGIVSLVAANWEDIPGRLRLLMHMVLIAGLAFWLYRQPQRPGFLGLFLKDVLLFVWAVLGLTFFGHLGQVYQTSSPLWQPLAIWLVLFAPIMLALGRGWLVALLLMTGLVGTAIAYIGWYADQTSDPSALILALVTSIPVVVVPCAWAMLGRTGRDDFWKLIAQIALGVIAFGVTLKLLIATLAGPEIGEKGTALSLSLLHAFIWSICALAVLASDRSRYGKAIAAILAMGGVIGLIGHFVGSQSSLLGGLIFMAYWAGIGAMAVYAGWRGVFQVAVTLVALRLVILSFELASDLLTSGFGLIVAGLLVIGIAIGAYRFSKAFAPLRVASGGEGTA